jgi:hypothetical protein
MKEYNMYFKVLTRIPFMLVERQIYTTTRSRLFIQLKCNAVGCEGMIVQRGDVPSFSLKCDLNLLPYALGIVDPC